MSLTQAASNVVSKVPADKLSGVPYVGLIGDALDINEIRKDLTGDNRWRGVRRLTSKIVKLIAQYVPPPYNLIAIAVIVAVVLVIIAMIAGVTLAFAVSLHVTGVTNRFGDGTWVCDEDMVALCNVRTGGESDFTSEEIKEFREEMEEEDNEVKECLAAAPPVTTQPPTLYMATEEEKRAVIDYQRGLRDKWREEVNNYRNYAREEAKQGRRVPPIKVEEPKIGATPNGVDRNNAYRVAKRDQRRVPNAPRELPLDASASALVDPDLISVRSPVLRSGDQIMRPNGRAVNEINNAVDTVPEGTTVAAATSFLYTAYAGGVVNWDQFEKVVNAQSYRYITEDTAMTVSASFFKGEVDFTPYRKAVASSLISLYSEEIIVGDIEPAMAVFEDC